jgi:hypothetical protein
MKKEKLAREIAEALNDMDSLAMHRQFVEQYSEEFLRKNLHKALATSQKKIRKSRAALYVFLVQGRNSNVDTEEMATQDHYEWERQQEMPYGKHDKRGRNHFRD